MTSPIEHSIIVLSSIVSKKHKDDELAGLITKIASNCHLSGFLGDKGFSIEDPNNKEIEKITKELYEKYDVDLYK